MGTLEQAGQYLSECIRDTPLCTSPYGHLELVSPFDPALYPEILENLPATELYRDLRHHDATLPDGRSARLKFDLLPTNIDRLPGSQKTFWHEIARQMKSSPVNFAYKQKFAEILHSVTGRPIEKIKINCFPVLFRDIAGYKITIHPDSHRKAITTQYYLPADESQAHLGTLFHERQPDGSFDEGKLRPFTPNSGYAFCVTPDSWHSVRQMGPEDKPRNTLMNIFYYDRGWVYETLKSARGHLRGLYDQIRGTTSPEEYE
jgi:hypothetical protein